VFNLDTLKEEHRLKMFEYSAKENMGLWGRKWWQTAGKSVMKSFITYALQEILLCWWD